MARIQTGTYSYCSFQLRTAVTGCASCLASRSVAIAALRAEGPGAPGSVADVEKTRSRRRADAGQTGRGRGYGHLGRGQSDGAEEERTQFLSNVLRRIGIWYLVGIYGGSNITGGHS